MRLESRRIESEDKVVYTLELTGLDLTMADLTPFDRLLLNDCFADGRSIADRLLGLEAWVRAMERGYARRQEKTTEAAQGDGGLRDEVGAPD